ncbi:MAG: CBS domain-containing protein [Pelagibacteraceae bacterium]|jgi:CBS domain-containing protein
MITVKQFLKENNKNTWTIDKNKSVREALVLMKEKNIGCVIVTNENNKIEGIFSERDYARKCVLEGLNSQDTKVHQLMSKNIISISGDEQIDACMKIMTDKRIRHLPVLKENEILGIISIGDVVKIMINEQKYLIDQLQKFITT